MRIAPNIGIGDLLIFKMRSLVAGIQVDSVDIHTCIAHAYRRHGENYLRFIDDFVPRLFSGATVERDAGDNYTNLEHIHILDCYLYDRYMFAVPRSVFSEEPYIIIHTKALFDGNRPNFSETLRLHGTSFSNLRSKYPILLFGEREIENPDHFKAPNTYSLYTFLKENPGVIDMTRNSSASGNSIEEFEKDVHMINGAKCNVVVGYGGPLSISMAFGKKVLGYIGGIQHSVVNDYAKIHRFYRNIDSFLDALRIELTV